MDDSLGDETVSRHRYLSRLCSEVPSSTLICIHELQWFRSHLFDKSHFVHYDGNSSTQSNVQALKSGVPQVSVQGPLLFWGRVSLLRRWYTAIHLCKAWRCPTVPSRRRFSPYTDRTGQGTLVRREVERCALWLTLREPRTFVFWKHTTHRYWLLVIWTIHILDWLYHLHLCMSLSI